MKPPVFKYKTVHYYSSTARLFGWMATAIAVLRIYNGSWAAWLFLPAGVVLQFTYCYVAFDLINRTYRKGAYFAGLTFGRLLKLPGIDFLYLNKNKYNHIAESRASRAQFKSYKFDGYIKLADGATLHLVQEPTKEQAMQQMGKISDDLGIELRDQTDMKFF